METIITLAVVGLVIWLAFSLYTNFNETKVKTRRFSQAVAEEGAKASVVMYGIGKSAKAYADLQKEQNKSNNDYWKGVDSKDKANEKVNFATSIKRGVMKGENINFGSGITANTNDLVVRRMKVQATKVNVEELEKEEAKRQEAILKEEAEVVATNKKLKEAEASRLDRAMAGSSEL